MRVKEPVRFVFETQARIGPSQEKNRALWTLSTALGTTSSKPFSETFTLTLKQVGVDTLYSLPFSLQIGGHFT